MFACKSEEIARYVSIQFGKLLFETCYTLKKENLSGYEKFTYPS